MCKIVAMTKSNKLQSVSKASEAIGKILLRTERDGYGYAIRGKSNTFGEKSVCERFTSRIGSNLQINIPIIEKRNDSFGKLEAPEGAGIFHGRISTNDKGLSNCHPMIREAWHLIHNGVVTDHGAPYLKMTTNDSEDLLHRLIEGIGSVEKELSGYYAFAAIDPMGRLHIGRDSVATLFVAWSPSLESYLFGTTEELILEVADSLKAKIGPIDKVKENSYFIFDGNELQYSQAIAPRGFDRREASLSELSLGRALFDDGDFNIGSEGLVNDSGDSFTDLMRELESLDDSYSIFDVEGNELSPAEYYKLDSVSQLACVIQRPDGSVIDTEYFEEYLDEKGA